MGRHKELEDIFLNELVAEEERSFRANRIIQHQEKLIENLETLLLSGHMKKGVDTIDRKVQTVHEKIKPLVDESSSYASFVHKDNNIAKYSESNESSVKSIYFHKKRQRRNTRLANKEVPKVTFRQMRKSSTSTTIIPELKYSRSDTIDNTTDSAKSTFSKCTSKEKSGNRLDANIATQKASKNQICKNEMKNASGENARANGDFMARLFGLLRPKICQHQDDSVIRSHQKTSHSIVPNLKAPNPNNILKLFECIEIRLRNLQDDILTDRRNISTDNSRVQVIQNQLENMRQEGINTNDLMLRLQHLRTQFENSLNEIKWKIKGSIKFRDEKTHERWMTARKYFTAEEAYFLLTTTTED